jgi:hypothetical protein
MVTRDSTVADAAEVAARVLLDTHTHLAKKGARRAAH